MKWISKGEGASGTDGGGASDSGGEFDHVGRIAELGITSGRNDTLIDRNVANERVTRIAEHQGTRTGLDEAGAVESAREDETLGDIGNRGRVHGEGRGANEGTGIRNLEAVAIVVGHRQTIGQNCIDAGRSNDLVLSLIEGQGTTSPTDGDGSGADWVKGKATKRNGFHDSVADVRGRAVVQEGDSESIAEGIRIVVTRVTGRVKDERAQAGFAEAGDRANVWDVAQKRHS